MNDLVEVEKEETNVVSMNKESSLSPLVQAAMSGQVDTDKLNQLLDIQQRYEAIEAEKLYNNAVAQFKSEELILDKNKDVKYGNTEYSHITLGYALSKVNPVLSKYGLSISWSTKQADGGIYVTCKLSHSAGHFEESTLHSPPDGSGGKNSIQAIGSAVTYLKRYTAFSLLGLESADADDDGKGSEDEIEYLSEEQIANLQALIEEVNADESKFLAWLKVTSLSDIQAAAYDDCVRQLERKRK